MCVYSRLNTWQRIRKSNYSIRNQWNKNGKRFVSSRLLHLIFRAFPCKKGVSIVASWNEHLCIFPGNILIEETNPITPLVASIHQTIPM